MAKTVVKIDAAGVLRKIAKACVEPCFKCAALVETAAKQSLGKGAFSGYGPRGGKVMVPSKPGQPPHLRMGELRAGIRHARTSTGAVTGPTIFYGNIHEHGGEFGGRNFPKRPFMRPALYKMRRRFAPLFKNLKFNSHGGQ